MHVIKSNRATMGHWDFRFCGFGYFLDRFFGFLVFAPKTSVFGVHCGLRIFHFLEFGFWFSRKILMGFRIWYPMRFSVFPIWPIWVPDFSSIWAAITRLHWSWIATECKCKRDKPIEISQGSLGSLRIALPSPPRWWGGEGAATRRVRLHERTAKHGTLPEFLYQRHLKVGDQVAGHTCTWLVDSTF